MAQGSGDKTTPGLSVEDVAGPLAARQALGPDAEEAVIEAFLERTGKAIDDRVAERLAAQQPPQAQQMQQLPNPLAGPMGMHFPPMPPQPKRDHTPFVLAMASLFVGIPLTGIASQFGNGDGGTALIAVLVVWIGIAVVNVVYNRHQR